MIQLNPLVISHERVDDTTRYKITDKMNFLPFGLWPGKVSYHAHFEDFEAGVRTRTEAAMGFTSESTWEVQERAAESGKQELWLVETAKVTCSRLLRMFVEKTMKESHEQLCTRLVERLHAPP